MNHHFDIPVSGKLLKPVISKELKKKKKNVYEMTPKEREAFLRLGAKDFAKKFRPAMKKLAKG